MKLLQTLQIERNQPDEKKKLGRPKSYEKSVTVLLTLEKDERSKLRYLAKKSGMSVNDLIRHVLFNHLDDDIIEIYAEKLVVLREKMLEKSAKKFAKV